MFVRYWRGNSKVTGVHFIETFALNNGKKKDSKISTGKIPGDIKLYYTLFSSTALFVPLWNYFTKVTQQGWKREINMELEH